MRLWLNHTGEVSLREQLTTQIILAILSRELPPGHRLPSTRELARRFQIHSNTASAAYRQLESQGWVEFRHGSGVFVRSTRPIASLTPELALDQLIADMAAKARRLGQIEVVLELLATLSQLGCQPSVDLGLSRRRGRRLQLRRAIGGEKQAR